MTYILQTLILSILGLPRILKRTIVLAIDITLSVSSVLVAFYLRTGEWVPISGVGGWNPSLVILFALVIGPPMFFISGLYREIFRFSGTRWLVKLLKVMVLYAGIFIALFTFYGIPQVPRTIGLIQPIIFLIMVCASRVIFSFWFNNGKQIQLKTALVSNVLIYGAGAGGRQLLESLHHSYVMRVVGFLDDDSSKHGGSIDGIRIYNPKDLDNLVIKKNITKVLLAIPSLKGNQRNGVLKKISDAKVNVLTLPSMSDLLNGKYLVEQLKPLDIEDLLGRDIVLPNIDLLAKNSYSKVVLVTGAAGSIGSELCRQIARYDPELLICLDQNEEGLYRITEELSSNKLSATGLKIKLKPILASVNDEASLRKLFLLNRPDIIYHAAAYKHVPIVEDNPVVAVKNNIFGTLMIAQLSDEFKVDRMILISTDKAVRPTNIMGTTKRIAELILQSLAQRSTSTIFSMVRFGNVLNSSGSVVPKFRKQIDVGGPITITDLRVTRFFMMIPEAAQLVIQAGALAKGGEVFLLDMGEPIKIMDLACKMIELSGLEIKSPQNPAGDIEIQEIGLRPGEKLYEELLIHGNPEKTTHQKIFKSSEEYLPFEILSTKLQKLYSAVELFDEKALLKILEELVLEYQPDHRQN